LNFVPETYATFTGDLPDLTHLCLFKVDPLVGVGILDINPHLALTIVDRILGGRGHSVSAERFPTEIEIGLLRTSSRSCSRSGASSGRPNRT